MNAVVYDAGVLIAADRSERQIWAEHRVRLASGIVPLVPSPVVAQVSRSPKQAEMRRLLRGCEIVPFTEADAHNTGVLLGKSGSRDVVDAAVVVLAIERRADIQSGDGKDIRQLLAAAGAKLRVLEV
jgi:hypothetical protein